jgi:hypothetical protein
MDAKNALTRKMAHRFGLKLAEPLRKNEKFPAFLRKMFKWKLLKTSATVMLGSKLLAKCEL